MAKFLLSLGRTAARRGMRVGLEEVNGQPAAVATEADGTCASVMVLDIVNGRVHAIRSVVNPDKLAHVHRRGHGDDAGGLL